MHYIDYGNQEWVNENEIMPLPGTLCRVAPRAFPCALSQVRILGLVVPWNSFIKSQQLK